MNGGSIVLRKGRYSYQDSIVSDPTKECALRFKNYGDKEIMDHIYEKYPEYTIFSRYDRKMDYAPGSRGIVTVGYEGKSVDAFLFELIREEVNVLMDVRKNAHSMKFGFSKTKLRDYAGKMGIEYVHMPELGIESTARKNLETYDDYAALFAEYRKNLDTKSDALAAIESIGRRKKAALMCFEKDVAYCHRGVIADALRERGTEVADLCGKRSECC